MAAVEIEFPGNLAAVSTVADLRALPSSQYLNNDLMLVRSNVTSGDNLGSFYYWSASSLVDDNGLTVIRPTDRTPLQAGRWLSVGKIEADSLAIYQATLADLKAYETANGATVYDGALFVWTPGNYSTTLAADLDVNVIKADGVPLTTGAWVRQSAGQMTYQRPTSAVIRPAGGKLEDRQDALDYIPVSLHAAILAGTSIEPIAGYLTPAFSGTSSDTLYFRKGQYGWEAEVDTNGRRVIGAGRDGTRLISLTSGVRSFFKLRGQNALIDGLYLDATQFLYGIRPEGANGAAIKRCGIEAAKIAGVLYPVAANNSSGFLENNVIRFNGKPYSLGTGNVPAGGGLFNITGLTINPTTLVTAGGTGPRFAYDMVQAGTQPPWEIVGCTATTITCYAPQNTVQAATGAAIRILQGSGVEIQRHGDNSNIKLLNNAIQSNALAGIDNQALYGVMAIGNTLEFNQYATTTGRRAGGGEHQPINSTFDTNYAEANGGGAGYYIGSARQYVINNLMADGVPNFGLENVRIADKLTLYDISYLISGVTGVKRYLYEDSTATPINIQIGTVVQFEQPASASNVIVTLESLPAATNASSLASYTDVVTTLIMGFMNAKTLTVRCANYLINNTPASGGFSSVTYSGNYRKLECRFEGTYGYRITANP